jgi:hypothetical protein
MPELSDKEKSALSWIAWSLIILILVYIFICQKWDTDSGIIGGPKYLYIQDNVIILTILKSFEILEIEFKEDIELSDKHNIYLVTKDSKSIIEKDKYTITPLNKRIIKVSIPSNLSGKISIRLNLAAAEFGAFPKRILIKEVRLDKKIVGLKTFHSDYLDEAESNTNYYKSFDIQNISNFLAMHIGNTLLSVIIYLLGIIFVFQLIVFVLTFIYRIFTLNQIKLAEEAFVPLKYFDIVSRDYAITIGFLGTVLSIWIALEVEGMDYSNFFQILNIIKKAVFTSVLGLLIKFIFSIREFFTKEVVFKN